MLHGFKQYFRGTYIPVPHDNGLAELKRLEKGHFLLALPADHERAWDYITGRDGLRHVTNEMIVTADRIDSMSKTAKDAIIIIPIPRRWFSKPQLEAKGVQGAIGEMIPLGDDWKLPSNYVWGYFSKWNENREQDVEPGQFYRNQSYHGHDELFNRWKKQYEVKKPLRLDVPTSRVPSPHAPHGYRNFHGYNEIDFDSSSQ